MILYKFINRGQKNFACLARLEFNFGRHKSGLIRKRRKISRDILKRIIKIIFGHLTSKMIRSY